MWLVVIIFGQHKVCDRKHKAINRNWANEGESRVMREQNKCASH